MKQEELQMIKDAEAEVPVPPVRFTIDDDMPKWCAFVAFCNLRRLILLKKHKETSFYVNNCLLHEKICFCPFHIPKLFVSLQRV